MPGGPRDLAQDIALLAAAQHNDPFAVLGRHADGQGGWTVTVYRPDAAEVMLTHQGGAIPLERLAPGFFRGPSPAPPLPYTLRVLPETGGPEEAVEDAYRFGLVISSEDAAALRLGRCWRADRVLGAHPDRLDSAPGVRFAVWAPNAARVSVVGDWNAWDARRHPMRYRHEIGVWEIFLPGVAPGAAYAFDVLSREGVPYRRRDPYARDLGRKAGGPARVARAKPTAPAPPSPAGNNWVAILEVDAREERLHLGPQREALVAEAARLGFTHLHLRSASPGLASWPEAWFVPGGAIGGDAGLRAIRSATRAAGLGLLADFPIAFFPDTPDGLRLFDGTPLYEPHDALTAAAAPANTWRFNLARFEVSNLLLSAALRWLEDYALDGLVLPSLAPLLRLDCPDSRTPLARNGMGGNVDTAALGWLRRLGELVVERRPGAMLLALDGDGWPLAQDRTVHGGLGLTGIGARWAGLLGDPAALWGALLRLERPSGLISLGDWPLAATANPPDLRQALQLLYCLPGCNHVPLAIARREPDLLTQLHALGRSHAALQPHADLQLLAQPTGTEGALAFSRHHAGQTLVAISELGSRARRLRCPAPGPGAYAPSDSWPCPKGASVLAAELDVGSPTGFSFDIETHPKHVQILITA